MIRLFLLALICLLAPVWVAGAEDFVLLRNGNVVSGRVDRPSPGQTGRIRLACDGAEFWFDPSEVMIVAPSLPAVYQHRRAQLSQPEAVDHLRLCLWCIENQLFAQASRELLDARRLSPSDPRLIAVERQLRNAAFPVQPASATVDRPRRPRPALTDQQVQQMPQGTLEEFTRRIQPLLVHNCTTSGCHTQQAEGGFELNRALLHGGANYRTTRANLAAVLQVIDRADPVRSPLLIAANEAHAGRQMAAFTGRRAPLGKRLEEWVAAVSAAPAQTESVATHRTTSGMFALVKEQRQRDRFVQSVESAQRAGVRDEFDPELFNRKFR